MSSFNFGRVRVSSIILLYIFILGQVAFAGVSTLGGRTGGYLSLSGEEFDSSSLEVIVSTDSITVWTLNMGDNAYTTNPTTVTITATLDTGYDAELNVKEIASSANNAADGKMYSATVDAINGEDGVLTNSLELDATTIGNDITALSESDQLLYTLADDGSKVIDFDYRQKIVPLDNPASDYGIVVTFTGRIVQESD